MRQSARVATSITRDGDPLPEYSATPPPGKGSAPLPPEIWENRAAVMVALHAQGMNRQEIADVMGVTKNTVSTWLRRARAEGKLREDIDARLSTDTVHRALEALHEHLEEGNLEAALAVLKGRGILRNYTNTNGAGHGPVTAIQIVYTTPSGAPPPQLVDVATLPGQVIGTPRRDEVVVP